MRKGIPKDFLDAHRWTKATASGTQGGNCVYGADLGDGHVGIRDGKAGPNGPILIFPTTAFAAFAARVKAGQFREQG